MAVEFLTDRVGYIPGAVNVGVVRAADDRYILIDAGLNDTSGKKAVKSIQELGGTVAAIITIYADTNAQWVKPWYGGWPGVFMPPCGVSARRATPSYYSASFASYSCSRGDILVWPYLPLCSRDAGGLRIARVYRLNTNMLRSRNIRFLSVRYS